MNLPLTLTPHIQDASAFSVLASYAELASELNRINRPQDALETIDYGAGMLEMQDGQLHTVCSASRRDQPLPSSIIISTVLAKHALQSALPPAALGLLDRLRAEAHDCKGDSKAAVDAALRVRRLRSQDLWPGFAGVFCSSSLLMPLSSFARGLRTLSFLVQTPSCMKR